MSVRVNAGSIMVVGRAGSITAFAMRQFLENLDGDFQLGQAWHRLSLDPPEAATRPADDPAAMFQQILQQLTQG